MRGRATTAGRGRSAAYGRTRKPGAGPPATRARLRCTGAGPNAEDSVVTRVQMTIRDGGMTALARIAPGEPVADGARAALAAAGIVHGVDARAVERLAALLADPQGKGEVVVATGTPPEPGQDGRLVPWRQAHFGIGTAHADGHVDYFERGFLQPIAAGQEIATIEAPSPGTAGRDVCGRVVPPRPGRPHRERFGAGVRVAGDTAFAAIGGVLVQDAERIDVTPLFVHQGDVDLDHGNLRSEGSLQVRGSVHDGFTVAATGDVEIAGSVFAATVTAGNAIRIAEGALGGADVRAGSHVTCRHATSARIAATGTVEIRDQATWCTIRAERILVRGGRGVVFGGTLRARQQIVVERAGTAQGARTRLSAGDLGEEGAEAVRQATDAAKVGRSAQRAMRDSGRIGPGKAARLSQRADDAVLAATLRQRAALREILQNASIEIVAAIEPGVVLEFGPHRIEFPTTRPGGRFRFAADRNAIVEETLT